jgi:hypothetical protein
MEGNEMNMIRKHLDDNIWNVEFKEKCDKNFCFNQGSGLEEEKEKIILKDLWEFIDQKVTNLKGFQNVELMEQNKEKTTVKQENKKGTGIAVEKRIGNGIQIDRKAKKSMIIKLKSGIIIGKYIL